MKPCILLFIALCVVHSARVGLDKDKAIALLKQCKEKTQAKEDIMDFVENHKFPTSPEGKCMLHCVLESRGWMKGDELDTKVVTNHLEKAYEKEPAQMELVAKAVADCSSKLKEWKGLDKCEIATRLFQCGHENHIGLG